MVNIGMEEAPNIARDAACVTCGYILRGLPENGRCPECGTPARLSIRGFRLAGAGARYLARLERGVQMMMVGMLLQVVGVVIGLLTSIAFAIGLMPSLLRILVTVTIMLVAQVLMCTGCSMATIGDPRFEKLERAWWPRHIVLPAALLTSLCVLMCTFMEVMDLRKLGVPRLGGYVLALIAMSLYNAASMSYAARLALRLPDPQLARTAVVAAWAMPALGLLMCGYGTFMVMLMHGLVLYRLGRHVQRVRCAHGDGAQRRPF